MSVLHLVTGGECRVIIKERGVVVTLQKFIKRLKIKCEVVSATITKKTMTGTASRR